MFRLPNSVFGKVPCPELEECGHCSVVNCIFDHSFTNKKRKQSEPGVQDTKRTRSDNIDKATPKESEPEKDVQILLPKALISSVVIPRIERISNLRTIAKYTHQLSSATPNKLAIEKEHELACSSKNADEYTSKVLDFLGLSSSKKPKEDPKHIIPLNVNPSPAILPTRRKFIEHIAHAIRRTQPENRFPVWTATEEEFKVASTSSSTTYSTNIRRRLFEINHPEKVKKAVVKQPGKQEYLRELQALCISPEKLAKFGYIMDFPPRIEEPTQERTCHRCKSEFKLRDATKKVDCRYHSGKIVKTDAGVRIYSCCGGVLGATDTEPCERSDYHVFYWNNPEEMHHAIPFVKTTNLWGTRKGSLEAVGIDCEMGFTSQGFELLRITAIDFFSGEEAFDILVKPKGEVLDLNTRWSGVAEIKEEALSFEDSMALLGEVIDANTVMIGHGLENDMNAMRLIHTKIVDTAILYPKHKATPTFRYSLKQLAFQYLGRNIQSGQHDSGEDSLAAIDVTKHFIEQELDWRNKATA
ncbi:putative RNA exonuclease [Clavispora lusitaniae]|uniref:RNA exonuclease n=1 Tax=Clavispora lusitaniae TaxID=36911 RepID=A0ACD0WNI5_CLALS|nr:putative RNA exonuclease [Clavispora lusitaniae]QFZ34464.1 putative RNA exonuclease [Clavispora lusitaniae]QFZ40149.1 putative RNA exonuclease [Clavispora lusitaniae]QFZ45829.1 putative RNA exonuclease [Clavispora lusitaniae]QFZ51491.1 putative RNA exonuclease [Clavispora lusitaniae]